MKDSKFKLYDHLEAQRSRHKIVKEALVGNKGEKPWTLMNLDGEECVSSAVHVVGFLVGFTGYSGRNLCKSRMSNIIREFDMTMMPSFVKPQSGTAPVRPKSKILAESKRTAHSSQ